DDVIAVLRSGDDARVPVARLARCTAGERVCMYMPSVVVRADCQRIAVKGELRKSFLSSLLWLREHGVAIEELLGVGYADGGRRLLREYGFVPAEDLEARLGASTPLLGGERRLHRLAKRPAQQSFWGAWLHQAAFGH